MAAGYKQGSGKLVCSLAVVWPVTLFRGKKEGILVLQRKALL